MSRNTWDRFRDKTAQAIANWALVHIATFDYQHKIWWLMKLGRTEADRRLETANFLKTKEQPRD